MKKFFLKILYGVLPLLIIAIPMDIGISYYLRQSNQYPGEFEVWSDIYNSKVENDIAIYGSSRAWIQIDPQILSDSLHLTAYNFGMDGHNFWLQYLRHLEILKYNKKPGMILLSVDIFTLQKRDDLSQSDQFLPYMFWNKNVRDFTSSFIGYKNVDYYIPLIRYVGKTQALKTGLKILFNGAPVNRLRNKGFLSMDRVWNLDLEKAKAGQEFYEIKFDKQTIELFERFIQECKKLDIELILVYTPEYIEGQKFVTNRREMINIYKNFSKQYHLTFYDYSEDEICLNRNLFYNAEHLNKYGADIFTRKFAGDLKLRTKKRELLLQK